MTEVHVVSHVYWNGDEQGGGGFWWWPTLAEAEAGFEFERKCWEGCRAYIRLVPAVAVPETDRDQITLWLDAHIELLEFGPGCLPASKVALT